MDRIGHIIGYTVIFLIFAGLARRISLSQCSRTVSGVEGKQGQISGLGGIVTKGAHALPRNKSRK